MFIVSHGEPQSETIKWRMTEINSLCFKVWAVLSSVMKSQAALLWPTQDVCPCCALSGLIGHLVATRFSDGSTISVMVLKSSLIYLIISTKCKSRKAGDLDANEMLSVSEKLCSYRFHLYDLHIQASTGGGAVLGHNFVSEGRLVYSVSAGNVKLPNQATFPFCKSLFPSTLKTSQKRK